MSYKLTFEDGSSAYLAHHGTKGMKWGVWNAETQAKYAGKNAEGGGGGGGGATDEVETPKLTDLDKELLDYVRNHSGAGNPLGNFVTGAFTTIDRGKAFVSQLFGGSPNEVVKKKKATFGNTTYVTEELANGRRRSWVDKKRDPYGIKKEQTKKQTQKTTVKDVSDRIAAKNFVAENVKTAKNLMGQKYNARTKIGPIYINQGKKNRYQPVDVLNYEIGKTASEIKKNKK